jgi:hypothetical protein
VFFIGRTYFLAIPSAVYFYRNSFSALMPMRGIGSLIATFAPEPRVGHSCDDLALIYPVE